MASIPTFFLATVIGWTYGGPHGLLWGAAVGWFLSLIPAAVEAAMHVNNHNDAQQSRKTIEGSLYVMTLHLKNIEDRLPPSRGYY